MFNVPTFRALSSVLRLRFSKRIESWNLKFQELVNAGLQLCRNSNAMLKSKGSYKLNGDHCNSLCGHKKRYSAQYFLPIGSCYHWQRAFPCPGKIDWIAGHWLADAGTCDIPQFIGLMASYGADPGGGVRLSRPGGRGYPQFSGAPLRRCQAPLLVVRFTRRGGFFETSRFAQRREQFFTCNNLSCVFFSKRTKLPLRKTCEHIADRGSGGGEVLSPIPTSKPIWCGYINKILDAIPSIWIRNLFIGLGQ